MDELELSIMSHGPDPAGDLQPMLDQFSAQFRCRVHVNVLAWENAWADLVKVALYNTGPHVSEVGMNWVGNLVAMNALRPFHPNELNALGGPTAFLASAWLSGHMIGDKQTWAVPWLADTRVIYYRCDWLDKAGIDEQTAFQSPAQFEQTLERLQASGVASPLVLPTLPTANTLHTLASWIWGAGGDFVDLAGKRTLFNQAQSREGIRAYLGLHRFLSRAARGLNPQQSDALYLQGQAAVTCSGPWLMLNNQDQPSTYDLLANTGTMLPPGVPFLGGSNLVIWRHTRQGRLAVELVRFLTGQIVQSQYTRQAGLLPARLEVLNSPLFADHPLDRVMTEGSKRGRSFPAFPAWGLIEDSLTTEMARLWSAVLSNPQIDLDAAIAERLDPLARRLDLILSQTL